MRNCIEEQLVRATVIGMEWERVTVHIAVRLEVNDGQIDKSSMKYYAVNSFYKASAMFKAISLGDGRIKLSMNITNPGDCQCLRIGTYSILVCDNERILAECMLDPSIVPYMQDYSRSFLYNNRSKTFIVNFSVAEEEDNLPLVMYVMDAAKSPVNLQTNREMIKEALTGPKILVKKNMGKICGRFLYQRYVKKYRKVEKTIMFMTEQSATLGGNLQAVYDRMVERGLNQEYTMLVSARPASYQKQTRKSTKQLIKKMAQCSMIFIDDHVPILDWLELDSETKLIQLWHAGAGFKSSGYNRWGHLGCPAPVSSYRQYKYGIAGSRNIGKFFSEVFGINEEQILPTGMPRMDKYLDKEYRAKKTEELYQQYPMCKGKKVILFAPTYRGKNRATAHYPYKMIDFKRLYDFCGEEYVVLFKMHPWVAFPVPIEESMKERFADVNTFPDINDLFYITDLLITDYSSNIFEFSLMKKPMLFYAFDKIQYSFSRGFHRNYEEAAPGKVCYDFDQLMQALEEKDFEYEKVEEYVGRHFDYIDSGASDRVIDWILLGNVPKDIEQEIHKNAKAMKKMRRLDFSEWKRA